MNVAIKLTKNWQSWAKNPQFLRTFEVLHLFQNVPFFHLPQYGLAKESHLGRLSEQAQVL